MLRYEDLMKECQFFDFTYSERHFCIGFDIDTGDTVGGHFRFFLIKQDSAFARLKFYAYHAPASRFVDTEK